jgi:hypothetical protein
MAEERPKIPPQELVKVLSRAGVPQSILFYVVLGMISAVRKLVHKSIAAGCPLEDTNCVNFTSVQPGTELEPSFEKEGFTFTAMDKEPLRMIGWGVPPGQSKLLVRQDGVEIRLPYPTDQVVVRGAQYTSQPLVLQAYDDGDLVNEVTAPAVENVLHTLVAEGAGITRVVLSGGGGEGLLFDVCIPKQEPVIE